MDVLGDFLKTVGITARVDPSPFTGPGWSHVERGREGTSGGARLRMLCIASGEYWLLDHQTRKPLISGDVAFLLESSFARLESVRTGSSLIVGEILFRAGAMALATLDLSNETIVRGQEDPESKELVMRLAREVHMQRGGWQQVSENLATSLFITSLRSSATNDSKPGEGKGWLRALKDPEIGNALSLMHQAPEHRWTVAELADQLSVSRSAFAARFKKATGRPPLEYLTWWRLQRATERLRNGEITTLYEAARSSGYQSEAAFSKAFRREFGISPGEVRRQSLAQKETPSQLQREIKKRLPFEAPEQEAGLNLVKSYESVRRPFEELLTSHHLTGAEYNILRILRGKECSMTMAEVQNHLLIPHDNLPAHFESLCRKQCIDQSAEAGRWEITSQGKSVLAKLDEPTLSLHRRQFANFSAGEITELNRLLVKLRTPTF